MRRGSSRRLTRWPTSLGRTGDEIAMTLPPCLVFGVHRIRPFADRNAGERAVADRRAGIRRSRRSADAWGRWRSFTGGIHGAPGRRLVRRVLDRVDDVLVTSTPAEIAADPLADLLLCGRRIVVQQRHRRQDHPRRAVAALKAMFFPEPFLDGMELTVFG